MVRRKASSRIVKAGSLRYSRLTVQQKAAYDRTTNLITDLRRGEGPYTKLLRKYHLGSRTAQQYGGQDLLGGTRGKPVRASNADKRVRDLVFPTHFGDIPLRTRSSKQASELSEFFQDRARLLRGKLGVHEFEAKWRGVHIAGQELLADSSIIFRIANAGVLKMENLYASTASAR